MRAHPIVTRSPSPRWAAGLLAFGLLVGAGLAPAADSVIWPPGLGPQPVGKVMSLGPVRTSAVGASAEPPPSAAPDLHRPVLKIAVSSAWGLPLALYAGEPRQLKGGVALALGQALASELQMRAQFSIWPRGRIELSAVQGETDLICHTSPAWLARRDLFTWSGPLWHSGDWLVSRRGTKVPEQLSHLEGQTVGTVEHYRYEAATRLKTPWVRDDAPSEIQLLRKMAAGRNDRAIISALSFMYWRNQPEFKGVFNDEVLVLDETISECALSKRSGLAPEAFLQAIQRMRQRGDIPRVLHPELGG